ncbi:hypothetical protein LLH06_10820 [Mucilaginibacter daejeonensis]|uniref:hypothetical protein n=1 Tax=Mucilaginibacter daejeonensis TaxID=398049 RepID=UPI001D1796DE|nr:hypothetical protein [Mucilaginibacter daejeonensis]UEG51466.1 hypothetical protein LLH06_10820 [Mucilaginibacter daejeonensis]
MNTKKKWLCLSIFAPKQAWSRIIKTEINYFLSHQFSQRPSFKLAFSYHERANIQFSIQVDMDLAAVTAEALDIHFKRIFPEHDFSSGQVGNSSNGLFMEIPNNSIHYGRYKVVEENFPEFTDIISILIVEMLAERRINDNAILSFGLSLMFGLVKALTKELSEKDVLKFIIQTQRFAPPKDNSGAIIYDFFSDQFIENKEAVTDLYDQIMGIDQSIESGIGRWVNHVRDLSDGPILRKKGREEVVGQLFQTALTKINAQLGFNTLIHSILTVFVFETLKYRLSLAG